jgi:hypothetical protein
MRDLLPYAHGGTLMVEMKLDVCSTVRCFCAALAMSGSLLAQEQPRPIPVGLDAYRQWDQWPDQRIGMRAYMRSTYDRSGGNEGADASHYLYQLADDFNVTLDLEGQGILIFSRYNHWHGSPWHYVVDGNDHLIQESSTADPLHPVSGSVFLPSVAFPSPLNETWSTTKGADLIWSPIPFERSFQMAYTRTHYGTGYYIYDLFAPGTPLSSPMHSWDESKAPGGDVLDLISRSGTDVAPTREAKERSGKLNVPATGAVTAVDIKERATIRALTFSIPRDQAHAFEKVRLRVTWDRRKEPSIDTPIALFHGAGTLYNRDGRKYLVKAFPVSIRFTKDRINLACYFPMPFFRSAHIELVGGGETVDGVEWTVRTVPLQGPSNQLAYFHATYRNIPQPTSGEDMVLLDTRGTENAKQWSESFVGTSFIFSHNANLTTLEGDPRFFFDDSLTPQAQGTGTEEWGGGGDYWGGLNMSLAFAGHPVGARNAKAAVNEEDKIESAYRFLLADLMPFGKNALIRLEHGGEDESTEHYETIAYWYGLPSASLVETDRLQIGDAADEKAHGYSSPQASAPYEISSRYEWGVDTLNGKEIFPETQDRGRTTKTTSEFRLRLRPDNFGVLLRRKLDYSLADQRADVYVATDAKSEWKFAGIWYLAGSNTCVRSAPRDELGVTQHVVETSNRRFRDDEFLVSREMTRGRKQIWVRIRFTPVNRPLFPGYPIGHQAWSEIKYTAYSFVAPKDVR